MSRISEHRHYRSGPLRVLWPSPARPARRRHADRADADYGVPAEPTWRGIDWPGLTHRTEILGSTLSYVDLGAGDETVVFIHGLGGCWQNWLESLPAIAASGRRVIAVDLPGFGQSAMPQEQISITHFAKTVDALCEHLGTGPVQVVGNSMGGFTAAEMAIRHPARVAGLVLVDAAGITSNEIAKNPLAAKFALTALGGSGVATTSKDTGRPRAYDLLRRPAGVHALMAMVARHPTRLAKDLLAEQLQAMGSPGFMAALQGLFGYDYRDRLPDIACPTLIIQGEKDLLVPLGDAYVYDSLIPRSTMLILADTGHVPMLERAGVFNQALLEFLDQDASSDQPHAEHEPLLTEGAA